MWSSYFEWSSYLDLRIQKFYWKVNRRQFSIIYICAYIYTYLPLFLFLCFLVQSELFFSLSGNLVFLQFRKVFLHGIFDNCFCDICSDYCRNHKWSVSWLPLLSSISIIIYLFVFLLSVWYGFWTLFFTSLIWFLSVIFPCYWP